MSIDLTGIPIRMMQPAALRFGGVITPGTGGPTQRVDRIGSRWAFGFETSAMRIEPDGRRWGTLLDRADRDGVLIAIEQPDFDPGAPGRPTVTSNTASGRSVPITGATPNYAVRPGQWVSFVHGGRRYLDKVAEQVVLNSSGAGMLVLLNLIRTPLTAGDVVELGRPMIEGSLEGYQPGAWELERVTAFSFTVREDA